MLPKQNSSILIVESGSTKTQWMVVKDGLVERSIHGNGINASYMNKEDIELRIRENLDDEVRNSEFNAIYFYGAGCSGTIRINKVVNALKAVFKNANEVEVRNDLYASARALLGNKKGLVAILGTGSNVCFYDGKEITQRFTSFGYLLGDEGGGVSLGRVLLKRYLRKELEEDLLNSFKSEYQMTDDELIVDLYKSSQPNKWMASFTPFISKHRNHPEIKLLLDEAFNSFFNSLVSPYDLAGIKELHITGSIASVFKTEIEAAALKKGYKIGGVLKEPLEALMVYHLKEK